MSVNLKVLEDAGEAAGLCFDCTCVSTPTLHCLSLIAALSQDMIKVSVVTLERFLAELEGMLRLQYV